MVTEKPSVARDLGRVVGATAGGQGYLSGDGLVITWCVGHLVELEEPAAYDDAWRRWSMDTLPMLPDHFALRVREGSSDQWKVVERLLQDRRFTEVVNACDAGREGELIFRYAYELAGCRLPVRRFWASSLTDGAIRAAWERLAEGARYDDLAAAARSRSEADWLVGMNATRALTCRTRDMGGDALWSVGRVQTPTLAMIVARDREIEAFVPETYWRVEAQLVRDPLTWTARWFRRGTPEGPEKADEEPHEERVADEATAQLIAAAARGGMGEVVESKRRTRREPPPLLYDLTSLQRRANQRYGLSAQRTLEVAQALYERHKLITYPRTDARYLTTDQVEGLPVVLGAVGSVSVYRPFVDGLLDGPLRITNRLVDDAEVGDHHAILPTDRPVDPSRLSADERRIYDLVARRLLAALSPDAVIDLAEIVVEVPPAEGVVLPESVPSPLAFRAKGRVLREAGWQAVDPPARRKDVELPDVAVGDEVQVDEASVHEGQTRPPRPYDDASVLQAMETAGKQLDDAALARAMRRSGLGTPATRAAILQTLLDRDYVTRQGKTLVATATGRALIDAVPTDVLKSPELTGRWEARLADVESGAAEREAFMADVRAFVQVLVDDLRDAEVPEAARVRTRPEEASIGACPVCGTPVRPRGPVFTCDTGRSCPFVVFATMSGRAISPRMVRELLQQRRTKKVKGFKSRSGKPFEAGLEVREDGSVGFWFDDEGPGSSGRAAAAAPSAPSATEDPDSPSARGPDLADPTGSACPACGQGHVIRGRTAWGCSRWREGCTWRRPLPSGPAAST